MRRAELTVQNPFRQAPFLIRVYSRCSENNFLSLGISRIYSAAFHSGSTHLAFLSTSALGLRWIHVRDAVRGVPLLQGGQPFGWKPATQPTKPAGMVSNDALPLDFVQLLGPGISIRFPSGEHIVDRVTQQVSHRHQSLLVSDLGFEALIFRLEGAPLGP